MISADQGTVTLERQASTVGFPSFDEPVLPLDPGVEQLFSDRVGRYLQDTPLTPDFPRPRRSRRRCGSARRASRSTA